MSHATTNAGKCTAEGVAEYLWEYAAEYAPYSSPIEIGDGVELRYRTSSSPSTGVTVIEKEWPVGFHLVTIDEDGNETYETDETLVDAIRRLAARLARDGLPSEGPLVSADPE